MRNLYVDTLPVSLYLTVLLSGPDWQRGATLIFLLSGTSTPIRNSPETIFYL